MKKTDTKKLSEEKALQRIDAGDAPRTKAPYDPMGTSTQFATELTDGRRPNIRVSVNAPQYVGRGGMKVDRGDPVDNSLS